MSNNNNDNFNVQAGLEGHMPPIMQKVFAGNGANVPTMQAIPPAEQATSQPVAQVSTPQQTSSAPSTNT